MSARPTIPRRTFQVIAGVSLVAPVAVTWWVGPRAYHAFGGGALGVLGVALTLLGATLVLAIALLPLRARTDMPTISSELSSLRAGGVGEGVARARRELNAMAAASDPATRRRYHVRMLVGSVVVTIALGAATAAMLLGKADRIFIFAPVGTVVGFAFTIYHLAKALLSRDHGA